jgi:hypothetical protein
MKRNSCFWPTNDPRARTEWDFRAAWQGRDERKYRFYFLSPEEVWLCHCYEFDRTLPRTVKDVLQWRGKNDCADFETLLEHYWRTDGNGKEGIPIVSNWFYMIWPEWPQKPYLSISSGERRKRFERMWPKATSRPRKLKLLPLGEGYRAFNDLSKCSELVRHVFQRRIPEQRVSFDGETYTVWYKDHRDEMEYPRVVAAFEIDFALSPTRLAKLFENWCREHQNKNKWKAKPNRGQTSDTDKLRTQLKDLGAWRLVQAGLAYERAAKYTQEMSGQPLFADKADWSRAVATANELIFRCS